MNFKEFTTYLEKIESISSRTEQTKILAEIISSLTSDNIKYAMYILQGRIAPKFVPLEFNFSNNLILKALEEIDSTAPDTYKKTGDIGLTAYEVVSETSKDPLSIKDTWEKLYKIATMEGTGSQSKKAEALTHLLERISKLEAKFITRIIVGKLRMGISDKTILDALSWYKTGDKSLRKKLDRAFGIRADIGDIAKSIKDIPKDESTNAYINNLKVIPGTPILSKLVEREKSTSDIITRMQTCFAQPKLDGLRAQVHMWKDKKLGKTNVKIFSRNLEEMTHMFPDIVENASKLKVDSIVYDSEAIGFNLDNGALLPFQKTIQRKRKHNVKGKAKEIPVKTLMFDILYLNGKDLTQIPIEKRIDYMKDITSQKDIHPFIEMLETKKFTKDTTLSEYFEKNIAEGLEGIIAKKEKTTYEPGTRNYDWIKLKASSKSDFVDTIDAVVLGYYFGKGARAKFGIGAILVGVYDEKRDTYNTIAKIGTGMSDSILKQINNDLKDIEIDSKPENYNIENSLLPDKLVKPEIIVEVEADEITKSKMHSACQDQKGRGLSLRFPRLLKWRSDKQSPTSESELQNIIRS